DGSQVSDGLSAGAQTLTVRQVRRGRRGRQGQGTRMLANITSRGAVNSAYQTYPAYLTYLTYPTYLGLFLKTPPQEHRSSGEPSPHRCEQNEIICLQMPIRASIRQRQRNRGGGRVAEPIQIDHDSIGGHAESSGGRLDDPTVRLMRAEQ